MTLLEMLERICAGEGEEGDLELLEDISNAVKDASMCALGRTLPNPVLSTLRYFRDEYEAHIIEKRCPAKQCVALIEYHIDTEKCTGCTMCARNCPQEAISGERKKPHVIDLDKCIKCGICYQTCRFGAVDVLSPVRAAQTTNAR